MKLKGCMLAVVMPVLWGASFLHAGGPREKVQPTIVVEAYYPGASAQVVADVIAAPIEHQVNGVAKALHLRSRSGNDGKYALVVTFEGGFDAEKARALVQDRVALAQPVLPDLVKRLGVTVKKQSPLLMLVALTSPEAKYDALYLSNYATIHLWDELIGLPGAGRIVVFGQREYTLRVFLDPEKLQARNMVAADVINALKKLNDQIGAGPIGQPPKGVVELDFDLKALKHLANPEQFETIVVKTFGKNKVLLKDVGTVELAPSSSSTFAGYNGKPAIALGINPSAKPGSKEFPRVLAARLDALRSRLPKGLSLDVPFDFGGNPDCVLFDFRFPASASLSRVQDALFRYGKLLREVEGVQDVLELAENPWNALRKDPCVLVRLVPAEKRKTKRDDVIRVIRSKLEKEVDTAARLLDLSRPGALPRGSFPFECAISGPDAKKVQELAERVAEQLRKKKALVDVWVEQESIPRPSLHLDLDRQKAAALGVKARDVFDALQAHLGETYINDFNRFGRSWQIVVQMDALPRERAEDVKKLKARNNQGQIVSLDKIIQVRVVESPAAIHLLDTQPAVDLTANLAPGAAAADARAECQSLFASTRKEMRLPDEYRLIWMHDIAAAK